MTKKTVYILLLFLILAGTAMSQTNNSQQLYAKAQSEYSMGHFATCEQTALQMVPKSNGMLKTGAYRLLVLCAIKQGELEKATSYASMLLKYDAYFTPSLNDPQRFIDIINSLKSQEAGITTASRQAETLDETPVPVTLITEEMIRLSGASTLAELLTLYVPGMTMTEGLESNIAMHGIYSLNQDKILFMVDGHRLNSASTNAESPDFRSSLDKIQQIEVLRGPASSLYGNVALTAVVNILTRKGAAINGGRLTAIGGTQRTSGANFTVGGGNNAVDIIGWGSILKTDGFKEEINNGLGGFNTLYSHGYNGRPSYDLGIKARWQDFTLSANLQRSKRIPYFNVLQVPSDQWIGLKTVEGSSAVALFPEGVDVNAVRNFDYDKYASIGSDKPGVTRTNNRINLDYSHSVGNFDLQASAYLSLERTGFYNVLGDSVSSSTAMAMMLSVFGDTPVSTSLTNVKITRGVVCKMSWETVTFGGQAQLLANYNFLGHGSAILGAQYEHLTLSDGNFLMGGDYAAALALSSDALFDTGSEFCASGYAQLKHYFTDDIIINAGLRYDHKERFSGQVLRRMSPRFSAILKATNSVSLRASYNYSFVDAPFIYRASNIGLFSGSTDMAPETMNAIQAGATFHSPGSSFTAELSGFYNILNDLVVIDFKRLGNVGHMFSNAGKVREIGLEGSAQYSKNGFFFNINATWQRIVSSQNYTEYGSESYSTPELVINSTLAKTIYRGKGNGFFTGGQLGVRANVHFQSETNYPTADVLGCYYYQDLMAIMNKVPPQIVFGAGISYGWKFLGFDVGLKNITNNYYKVGSMMTDGVPVAGRQLLCKVTVDF